MDEILFRILEVETHRGLTNHRFSQFYAHVVGVVGSLYDPTDHETRGDFGQHLII